MLIDLTVAFGCAHKWINNSLLVAPSVKPVLSDFQGLVEQYLYYHLSDLLHLSVTKQLWFGGDALGALLGPLHISKRELCVICNSYRSCGETLEYLS